MLVSTRPSLLLDWFRVPYSLTGPGDADAPLGRCEWLEAARTDRAARFFWPTPGNEGLGAADEYRLEGITLFAAVVPDAVLEPTLSAEGDWQQLHVLRDGAGAPVASVWGRADGSVFLPFSPDEALIALWSEAYHEIAEAPVRRSGKRIAMRAYYALRPLMPRALQIALRRRFAAIQARRTFPAWPQETSLHDLCDLVLGLVAHVAGESVPTIAPWPAPYEWALVLTHDVELQVGFDHIHLMADLERELGYCSAWNLVPRRYQIDDTVVQRLRHDGSEIGVHGLYHDGRDLESEERVRERLPAMRAAAERWGATGFRSPATHRQWELMPLLGFDHDSSYPDTDPFEPYGGGCCSWWPYFNERLVELPITLLQDHTLFVILQRTDEAPWVEKAQFLRSRGGMALLITHPDYMLDEARLACYERLLQRFADDGTMWRALPADVNGWWRRRAESNVVAGGDGWTVEGPAASEARVVLVPPGPQAA